MTSNREEILQRANEELAQRVLSRTEDLERANRALVEEVIRHESTSKLQRALFLISEEASQAAELSQFLPVIHRIVQELMYADNFYIALYDPNADLISFPYFADTLDPPPPPRKPASGLTEYVLRSRQPAILEPEGIEALKAKGLVGNTPGSPTACWLGVPLALGDRFFGVIAVQSYSPSIRFSEKDKDVLGFVARQVSTAIERMNLEKMRRCYEFIVNSAHEYMTLVDRQYRYVAVNDAYCRAQNRPREKIVGRTPADIWGEERFDQIVKDKFDRCFAGEIVNYLSRFPFGSAGERCMDVTYYPFRNDEGVVTHAAVVSRDVTLLIQAQEALQLANEDLEARVRERTGELTRVIGQLQREIQERLQVEETLRRKEELFRALIENAQDTVAILNEQAVFTYHSPSVYQLLGYHPEELVGRTAFDFVHPDDLPAVMTAFKALLLSQERTTSKVEFRWRKKDGAWRVLEAIGSNLTGNPIIGGVVVNSRDVTERKIVEAALRETNVKLRELDHVKTEFLSTVSHELRTPLTSILGFGKIIRRKLADPEALATDPVTRAPSRSMVQVVENVGIIISEAERLTALVNDVLDITKMESGIVDWKQQPIRLGDLIEQAVAATQILIEQRDLIIRREIADGLPEVLGDHDRLLQVLINLMSNAIKFTERGSVTCTARQLEDRLLVGVVDTGIGIEAPDQTVVFEKFKQVGDTLTGKPKGTGLGLPICKQIIQHHGGTIWVESEPGRGSGFYFTLPVGRDVPFQVIPMDISSLSVRLLEQRSPDPFRILVPEKPIILVADDDENIRSLLKHELEGEGFRVLTAGNGIEALSLSREFLPNVIVMDVLMPMMGGYDAASVLKNDPRTRGIPIIILSCSVLPENARDIGLDSFLPKPLIIEDLFGEIGRLLAPAKPIMNLLLISEDETVVQSFRTLLSSTGLTVEGRTVGECLQDAGLLNPDVVIMDEGVPGWESALREIHRHCRFSHDFVFLLTGMHIKPRG